MTSRPSVLLSCLLLALAASLGAANPPSPAPAPQRPAAPPGAPAPAAPPGAPARPAAGPAVPGLQAPSAAAAPPADALPPALSVPVGANLRLTGAGCTVHLSNQVGMKGGLVWDRPAGAASPMTDPTAAGDAASLALLRSWGVAPDQKWYLMTLQAQASGQPVRYQRLFDLSEGGGAVRFSAELLYPNGTVRREERWRDGLPEAASDFDATGRVVRECDYVAGQPGDCRLNRWKNGRLVSTETRSAAGELLQTVSFGYTVRGRIHQTERRWPDGRLERFVYRYGEDGLNGNWSEDAEQGQSWLYDDSGRLLRQEDWVAGEVVRRVTLTWADVQGTRLASRVSEEPKTRFRMEEAFDEQGRVVQHDEWLKDELQARVSQEWDADGNLVLRNTVGPRGSESWSAEYRDKLAVVERYAKNGLPVKVLTRDGDDSIEEIYLNGVLRLRAWYHGSDKYQEEDIRDGQVYRTRTFKNR